MKSAFCALIILCFASSAFAVDREVQLNLVDEHGVGKSLGTIKLSDTEKGLLFTTNLNSLKPGVHGFHIHENASCAAAEKDGKMVAALAAGGHLDPAKTGKHEGPDGAGHLGDLPALTVKDDGSATTSVVAPRLKLADVVNRSIMLHAGGDNYADTPQALGGGGARMACGVING